MNSPAEERVIADLLDVLRLRYGLEGLRMERLPIGQGAINYQARGAGVRCFVKHYTPETDLSAEAAGIGLSETARAAGIPAAAVVPNADGQWIDRSSSTALSVWSWVDGDVITDHLSESQYATVGRTLGEIHKLFAELPESRLPANKSRDWRRVSVAGLHGTIEQLLTILEQRKAAGLLDEFDAAALVSLPQRKQQLRRLPELMTALPELGSQVLHGDYTFVNLLFRGESLSAVLDFRPPEPFLRSYDLGRIAFHPNTVALHPQWLQVATTLVTEYKIANPSVPLADVASCGRVALLQLLKSLYGIKQHYLQPGLIQEDLDTFWSLRHAAVGILLEHLDEVDAMLTSVGGSHD